MDAGDRAVLVGRGERDFELARQELADLVAHEVADERANVGGGVEQLALGHARPGVARHVADGVAAGLSSRESDVRDEPNHLGRLGERDVVELEVLAGRDVALDERAEVLGDLRESIHLVRRDAAERQLHTDHLHVRLALAVDALLEPEADELLLGEVAMDELVDLRVEVVELALEDRDHVPRDVLVDLGVRSGSRLAVGSGLCFWWGRSRLHGDTSRLSPALRRI